MNVPVRQVALVAAGGVLGFLLARYTDAPWITVIVLAALVVVFLRRRGRRSPPA